MSTPRMPPNFDPDQVRQELHRLRNAINVMSNTQRCLRAGQLDATARTRFEAAFDRGAGDAAEVIARIEGALGRLGGGVGGGAVEADR